MAVLPLKSLGALKTCGDLPRTGSLAILMVIHDAALAHYFPGPVVLWGGA